MQASGRIARQPRPRPQTEAAERTLRSRLPEALEAALGVALLLFFPLLVIAPRGIAALATTSLLIGAGLVLLKDRRPLADRIFSVPAGLFLGLAVWGLASALWSPDAARSLVRAAKLASLIVAGMAMTTAEIVSAPRRLTRFLVAGFVAGLLLAVLDLVTYGALTKPFSDRVYQPAWLNQASVAFAILLLPTGAALFALGYRWCAAALSIAAAATVFLLVGTAAKAALAAGAPVALLCYYQRVRFARIAAVLAVAAVVTAPLTFGQFDRVSGLVPMADSLKLSGGHRLLIWSFVSDRIAEHPLRGWGLDASRAIPGGRDPIRPSETWLPLHPHNAALQLWLELGVPGAVLFALLSGWFWLSVGRADWPALYGAAACGSLATAFVASAVTYGIWQEWWQGSLAFCLFMVLVMARVAAGGGERR